MTSIQELIAREIESQVTGGMTVNERAANAVAARIARDFVEADEGMVDTPGRPIHNGREADAWDEGYESAIRDYGTDIPWAGLASDDNPYRKANA